MAKSGEKWIIRENGQIVSSRRVFFPRLNGENGVFQGTALLTLDAKGRMNMPSRHREVLADKFSPELTLTRHPDGCILIYPRSEWEAKRRSLLKLPYSARFLQRLVLGSAVDLRMDDAGRVQIPADLRSLCGLQRDVALVGLGTHLELWDAKRLAALEEQAVQNAMSDMADFNF